MPSYRILVTVFLGALAALPVRAETFRVGLLRNTRPSAVEVRGTGIVRSAEGEWRFQGSAKVSQSGRQIAVLLPSGRRLAEEKLCIIPQRQDEPLTIEGRHFRGSFVFSVSGDKLTVVNEVDLEDYLRGVVPNEMFRGLESFRVQAVVSRTFALYIKNVERRHARDGFDICDGVCCQVYDGYDSEDALANQAIESTRSKVLLYRGKPILAAFDANAGGQTCTVDEAWPGSIRENFPYLRSLASPDDNAALGLSGYEACYRWSRSFQWEDLLKLLGSSVEKVGALRGYDLSMGASGRVVAITLRGTKGKLLLQRPETIRRTLKLPSARFEVRRDGDRLIFAGAGNGHGVGLSQHGAYGMAKRGLDYKRILAYYYPGAELV